MSSIAAALLTLVGYTSGVIVGKRGRPAVPSLGELLLIVLLIAAVLRTTAGSGHWLTIAAGLVTGLVVGIAVGAFKTRPGRNTPAAARRTPAPERGWKRFAHEMGNYQGRLMMGFFYFVVVAPFGVIARFAIDPLRRRRRASAESAWSSRTDSPATLDALRSQA